MTAELEYSFIDIVSDLNISYELMTRAVRVKEVVKDKLSRIFNVNLANIEKAVVEAEQEVQSEKEKETSVPEEKHEEPEVENEDKSLEHLIDLSPENLNLLNNMLDNLGKQPNVPTTPKRAVLFTGNLFTKIREVNSKWFTLEKEPELPNVELENQLGGEVIPGTWDDVVENDLQPVINPTVENVETPVVPEVAEPNVNLENTISIPPIATTDNAVNNDSLVEGSNPMNVEVELPSSEPTPVVPEIELPTMPEEQPQVEINANEASDLPGFMPNLFGEINNEVPVSEEYVPEPAEVNTEEVNNEVQVEEPPVVESAVVPETEEANEVELPSVEPEVEVKNEENL